MLSMRRLVLLAFVLLACSTIDAFSFVNSIGAVRGSLAKRRATAATRRPQLPLVAKSTNDASASSETHTAQKKGNSVEWKQRRQILGEALRLGACGCAACFAVAPQGANALAQLVKPPQEALEKYDVPRDAFLDAAFACGMATGMGDYEEAASVRKAKLFRSLLASLPRTGAVVAEVGMGSFPNAPYFAQRGAPGGIDIIGVDPNDKMASYARENARRARLIAGKPGPFAPASPAMGGGGMGGGSVPNSLRIVHGVSEALPLDDDSCDAVVCTLTMCSVVDPKESLAEIRRVLKPGGKFLFWEHVLSETDDQLRRQQIALTPQQVKRADGCHLDRRTGETIKGAGFSELDMEYFELQDFGFLNPTVAGIATV